DIDVARLGDQMIQPLERHLDDVVVGIIGNADQRQPLRFDLIAKAERGDLDFGLFAFEHGGDAIEETAPLLFLELAGGHGKSPIGTRRGIAVEHAPPVLIANEPTTALSAIWLKKILGLGIVQSSRSSPR